MSKVTAENRLPQVMERTEAFALYAIFRDFAKQINYLTDAIGASSGSTNLTYTAASRLLESSTGTDVTLPLATSSAAGLAPAGSFEPEYSRQFLTMGS